MPDPIIIHLGPGETIAQGLIRAGLMAPPGDGPHEVTTIQPGVHIIGAGNFKQTRIIEPFLPPEATP